MQEMLVKYREEQVEIKIDNKVLKSTVQTLEGTS